MSQTGLQVQQVNFNGDILLAAQDNNNRVWVGVSFVCNGIGFSKNEKDRQIKNVQSDIVLNRGCVKFDAGVFDPNNATIAILIDYLPLWLAKISITPRMQKESPELVEKLIAYQLKAKDVLAAAFLPKEYINSIPYNQLDFNALQTIITDQSKDLNFIKQQVFQLSSSLSYFAKEHRNKANVWKKEINARILEVNKVSGISNSKLLNQLFYKMKENGCDLIKLSNDCAFKNSIVGYSPMDYIDQHEDARQQFEGLLDELEASYKVDEQPKICEGKAAIQIPEQVPADIILAAIQPLIEKYNDHSVGGNCTYRKVYAAMGVSWQNRKTRYKNEHGLKNQPRKITLIEQDKKLMKLFVKTVNTLLSEPLTQEV